MMTVSDAANPQSWDAFLAAQPYSPFLQSWTMGDVYAAIKQPALRLEMRKDNAIVGVCFAHVVPARRGKHLSIPYGPVFDYGLQPADFAELLPALHKRLRELAEEHGCSFIRVSPFLTPDDGKAISDGFQAAGARVMSSPLHLLAEHVWHLNLKGATEEALLADMRKTTRNLIRRAEKEGVTIEASSQPEADLQHFLTLHDETRKRHKFTPYTNTFFRAQVAAFAPKKQCTLYLARYQGNVIAASIHMHFGGETSYHHGASADAFKKIPSSYLLQWTAIKDALKRGDRMYNFWGIAPQTAEGEFSKSHPFAGVTLFKTGFGGSMLSLAHCMDLPVSPRYYGTRAIEIVRKWRRGF